MVKNPVAEKNEAFIRNVSHANSLKRIADRYKGDREEAMEYTENFSTNRMGTRTIPDAWDDIWNDMGGKYVVKPKKHNHGIASIRRNPKILCEMPDDDLDDDYDYDNLDDLDDDDEYNDEYDEEEYLYE